MLEHDIIRQWFNFPQDASVQVGIGDDAAVVLPPPGQRLAISSDTLNEGTHFFSDVDAFFLARKAAAVSLSDMAAMGALPLWMTVALTTQYDKTWLSRFASGLRSSADDYRYTIIGGDLCRATMTSVTTTAIGTVKQQPLTRQGATVGDKIWLSGCLGEAALAVYCRQHNPLLAAEYQHLIAGKLDNPIPRIALGQKLSSVATAAIDLSDGLIIAAEDIARQSNVKMIVQLSAIPIAPSLATLPSALKYHLLLAGGDDYELLFCTPSSQTFAAEDNLFCIGDVVMGSGVEVLNRHGLVVESKGYEHYFGD